MVVSTASQDEVHRAGVEPPNKGRQIGEMRRRWQRRPLAGVPNIEGTSRLHASAKVKAENEGRKTMNVGALILGILGGLFGLGIGLSGYIFGGIAG